MDAEFSKPQPKLVDSPAALLAHCRAHADGLVQIKPKVLFMKIEAAQPGPASMRINVPSSGLGSVTLLEAAALISLIKLIRPRAIFEFGTFLGYSSALLVENSGQDCAVYSLDLGESHVGAKPMDSYSEAEVRQDGDTNDAYLRSAQGALGPRYTTALMEPDKARLHLLKQDSRAFDPAAHGLDGAVDLVFVDGGHDTETVTIDTANARRMIGDSGVIVWHDYGSTIHGDVTAFVDALAKNERVVWVQHTMLAMAFIGRAGQDFLEIGA